MILFKEFSDLRLGLAFHVAVDILGVLVRIVPRVAASALGGPVGGYVGVVPVAAQRIIDAQFETVFAAGHGQFFQRVAVEGREVAEVVFTAWRMVHGKTVMVFGGIDNISGAHVLCGLHPFVGVEAEGVEFPDLGLIFADGDAGFEHDEFAIIAASFPFAGKGGVSAPVDEQAKTCLSEPFHLILLQGVGGGGSGHEWRRDPVRMAFTGEGQQLEGHHCTDYPCFFHSQLGCLIILQK